jgi:hypothetical protein
LHFQKIKGALPYKPYFQSLVVLCSPI